MGGDLAEAARVLGVLMQLDAATAQRATGHFQNGMTSGPEFMGKAMGMRGALMSGSTAELLQLVVDCFGLQGAEAEAAVDALRARYPAPPASADEAGRKAAQADLKAAANAGTAVGSDGSGSIDRK